MQFELSFYLDDRSVSNQIVATMRETAPSVGFSVVSAEESDAIGITAADVIVNIIVSFGTSIAANVASTRINQVLENIQKQYREVSSTSAQLKAGANGVTANSDEPPVAGTE